MFGISQQHGNPTCCIYFVQKISSKLEPTQSKTKPISDMASSIHPISPVQKTSPSDRGVERETGNKATSQEKLGLTEICSSLVGGFNPSEKYSSNWKSSRVKIWNI